MTPTHQALLDIFLEKLRRDYAQDVSLAFVYGSAVSGKVHAHSDLDLAFVPSTPRGAALGVTFLLDGDGHDFFAMDWARLERIASLDDPMTSLITQAQVVYSATPEDAARFARLQALAREAASAQNDAQARKAAAALLDRARIDCMQMLLAEDLGRVREHAGGVVYYLSDALALLNRRPFTHGMKRREEAFAAMPRLPEGFIALYRGVIRATSRDEIVMAAWALLAAFERFHEALRQEYEVPAGPGDVLPGTYEEMVCNWKHKLRLACRTDDSGLAFLTGVCWQNFLDHVTEAAGLEPMDLMGHFDAGDLPAFCAAADDVEAAYLALLARYGVPIRAYDSLEAFRMDMLGEAQASF